MLIDKRNKALRTYDCSLVQFHNIWTKEVLNIGVILSDGDNNYLHLPKRFDKLKSCLQFEEISGINYTIDIIRDRIENQKFIPYGEVSNAVLITDSKSFKTDQLGEQALYEAVDRFMMIPKLREPDNGADAATSKYDKLSILTLIENRASDLKIKNFMHRHHFNNVAAKMIDMALVDDDKKPYSIANAASIHVSGNFVDTVMQAVGTLEEARWRGEVENRFLYVPVMKEETAMKPKERKDLGWAKEYAGHYGIEVETDKRQDAVLERLQVKKPEVAT